MQRSRKESISSGCGQPGFLVPRPVFPYGLTLSCMMDCSGAIMAHCSFDHPGSGHHPTSASQVCGITGTGILKIMERIVETQATLSKAQGSARVSKRH
ncbi:protein fantom-like [Pan paniscus]|uniref:protein fantom-like n=1 Tax=Pan paniscus TaxID=9597 RepID=UPI002436958D|nr:protein fantom-like [Pan paniscus]